MKIVLRLCLSTELHVPYFAHLDLSHQDDHHTPPQNHVCVESILQESVIHGYVVFTGNYLSPESFHLFDSFTQVPDEVEPDRVPISHFRKAENLRKLCDKHESVRQGALLCLKPSSCIPWYYMNYSRGTTSSHPDLEANLKVDVRFASINKHLKTIEDPQEALWVAGNLLTLTVDQSVKKGTELFMDYPSLPLSKRHEMAAKRRWSDACFL